MLQQLAAQLKLAEEKEITYETLVPFLVLLSILLTFWLIYFGVADDVVALLDLNSAAYAATEEVQPTVFLNGFTFDQELNPDLYYTQGYGYPQ